MQQQRLGLPRKSFLIFIKHFFSKIFNGRIISINLQSLRQNVCSGVMLCNNWTDFKGILNRWPCDVSQYCRVYKSCLNWQHRVISKKKKHSEMYNILYSLNPTHFHPLQNYRNCCFSISNQSSNYFVRTPFIWKEIEGRKKQMYFFFTSHNLTTQLRSPSLLLCSFAYIPIIHTQFKEIQRNGISLFA